MHKISISAAFSSSSSSFGGSPNENGGAGTVIARDKSVAFSSEAKLSNLGESFGRFPPPSFPFSNEKTSFPPGFSPLLSATKDADLFTLFFRSFSMVVLVMGKTPALSLKAFSLASTRRDKRFLSDFDSGTELEDAERGVAALPFISFLFIVLFSEDVSGEVEDEDIEEVRSVALPERETENDRLGENPE